MSLIEERFLRRASGLKITVWSLTLGSAAILPLLLYVGFGPADGNPIGLGLLAIAAVPVACVGAVAGMIKILVEYYSARRK